jgi:hypothetical protein
MGQRRRGGSRKRQDGKKRTVKFPNRTHISHNCRDVPQAAQAHICLCRAAITPRRKNKEFLFLAKAKFAFQRNFFIFSLEMNFSLFSRVLVGRVGIFRGNNLLLQK